MELKVMGLDPGTLKMGYGILSLKQDKTELLDYGAFVFSGKQCMGQRLCLINENLENLFKKYKPDHVAIEKMFLGKNPDSAFKLGQAFAMGLYQSYKWSCDVFQYSAKTIKKSVTGHGGADKESVRYFINNIFQPKKKIDFQDTSDAIAVALCHGYHVQNKRMS